MTLEQIKTRKKELLEEIEKAETKERIAELQEEVRKLNEDKEKLEEEAREKRNLLNEIAEGKGKKIEGGANTTMTREERAKKLKDILSSEAYEIAYVEDIKHNTDKNTRSLLTELVTGGSVPVPTYLEERINTNWESNEIYNLVNKTYYKGVAKIPFELSATDAEMHEEGAAAPNEEQLVLGTVEIKPATIKKWITISTEALELKGREFLDYIYDEIEYRIIKKLAGNIVNAILTAPTTATSTAASITTTQVARDVTVSDLITALGDISAEAKNVVYVMNKKTFYGKVINLTASTGQPIFTPVADNGELRPNIFGHPVVFSDDLKEQDGTTTHETDIIVGDLSGVTVNHPSERNVNFITDPYSLAEDDLVKIVGKLMANAKVTKDKHFALLQFRKPL
jgi:HK97 family phage major capsid protein